MIVVGVDPSLTATGLVCLNIRPGHTAEAEVLHRVTVRPRAKEAITWRLHELVAGVRQFFHEIAAIPVDGIACEDPTDWQPLRRGARVEVTRQVKFGASFGAVAVVLPEFVQRPDHGMTAVLAFYPTREWLPREPTRNRFLSHVEHARRLVMWYPQFRPLTDDELMAASLAVFHGRQRRLRAAVAS